MTELDALSLADQAVMLGLVTRSEAREAINDAEDGSLDAAARSFLRKGLLTSWQVDKIKKGGDPSGYFFGGCKVLFHLAEGTFARVYRGVKVDTGKPVAIKVLRQRFCNDPVAVQQFNKEAEAGMKLRHPNIVQILDYGEDDKKYYMIMEYVEGANLRDFLKIRSRIEPEQAMPLMLGLARGLKYSIDQGVTHRDIKGTNILISNAGEGKLVDFGLATINADEQRGPAQNQRTIDYSALERTCGSQKGDPRSDIYFLGCVFYQMITGQLPLKEVESSDMLAKMLKRSFGAIVPLSEHRLAPDPELAHVVERMMKMDLKSRYQTMDQVIADLEGYERRIKGGITGMEMTLEEEPDFMADLGDIFGVGGTAEAAASEAAAGLPGASETADEVRASRKTLMCVEAQPEIRDAFRKALAKMGYKIILMGDAENAVERFAEEPTDAIVYDCDGLGPDSATALAEIRDKAAEEGRPFLALVILGPKQEALRASLPTGPGVVVMVKPLKMKQVQNAVSRLLPQG